MFDQTYELLKKSDAAIVVSGSATLETAILNVPEIIVYQTSPITFYLGKLFVKLQNLGLPNLIMEHQIVASRYDTQKAFGGVGFNFI